MALLIIFSWTPQLIRRIYEQGDGTVAYEDPFSAGSAVQWFNGKEFNGQSSPASRLACFLCFKAVQLAEKASKVGVHDLPPGLM